MENFFSAIYQDGRVQIAGKWFDAGAFAVNLCNQFYEDDLAARLSVFCTHGDALLRDLRRGYLKLSDFRGALFEYEQILSVLPRLHPFDLLDISRERQNLRELFTERNGRLILEFLNALGENAGAEEGLQILDVVPADNAELFQKGQNLVKQILRAEKLYHSIGDDMRICFRGIRKFEAMEDDAERLDEKGLLDFAMEIFREPELPSRMRYIAADGCVGREMVFSSYKSFILTDFFEGLHHGHYPRQCIVCEKYFLMKSARWQYYCDGWSGRLIRGRRVSCRQYGEYMRQKENAEDNPIKDRYRRRCSCIRAEKSKGRITADFAERAKALALNRYERATCDPDYAMTKYAEELERDKLYRDVERGLDE